MSNLDVDIDDKDVKDGIDLYVIVEEWVHGQKWKILIWYALIKA